MNILIKLVSNALAVDQQAPVGRNRNPVFTPNGEYVVTIAPTTHSRPDDARLEISVAPHEVL